MEPELKGWFSSVCTTLLVVLIGYIIFIYYKRFRTYYLMRKCPTYTPPDVPIFGHLFLLARIPDAQKLWKFFLDYHIKGKQTLFWMGHVLYMVVTTVDVAEAILMSSEALDKEIYYVLRPITDGVFLAEPERWKKLRRKLNLTFSPKLIELYKNDVSEQIEILVEVLRKLDGKEVNAVLYLQRFFYDIVARTHFGVETQEQVDKKHNVTAVGGHLVEYLLMTRAMKPYLQREWVYKLTKEFQYVKRLRAPALLAIEQVIEERLETAEKEQELGVKRHSPTYPEYVRDVLVDMKIPPTPQNICTQTGDLIIAGSDTTSVAACETLFYLAKYPEIQKKVFDEVMSIYGEDRHRMMTKDDLARMTYLDMVIKEVLRLCCPPGISRTIHKDINLGNYTLPKGTTLYIFIKSFHLNPEYFEKPNEFYPEHFLPEKVMKRPKFAYLPFSMGPRNCPGATFGIITLKWVVSSIVRNFVIECDTPLEEVKYKLVLMQEQVSGYNMRFLPRHQSSQTLE